MTNTKNKIETDKKGCPFLSFRTKVNERIDVKNIKRGQKKYTYAEIRVAGKELDQYKGKEVMVLVLRID
jgi:hypothetical protein